MKLAKSTANCGRRLWRLTARFITATLAAPSVPVTGGYGTVSAATWGALVSIVAKNSAPLANCANSPL